MCFSAFTFNKNAQAQIWKAKGYFDYVNEGLFDKTDII